MLHFSRWQTAAILGITALLCLAALPTFLPARTLAQLPRWAQHTVPLGADLAGGVHAVLAVDHSYVEREYIDDARREARRVLRQARIAYTQLTASADVIEISLLDKAAVPRAMQQLRRQLSPFFVESDGATVRLKLDRTVMRDIVSGRRAASMRAIDKRLKIVGDDGQVYALGADLIVVDLPDPDTPERLSRVHSMYF